MEVSRLLEFYWQALLPSVNRLEKTLPRLYQTGEGSSKHSDSVIGSGSGIDARVAFWLVMFAIATDIKGHWHCTGGASLREPVSVLLDKVPQPPGEFHAQALHVVYGMYRAESSSRYGEPEGHQLMKLSRIETVSYTHLTLPTTVIV